MATTCVKMNPHDPAGERRSRYRIAYPIALLQEEVAEIHTRRAAVDPAYQKPVGTPTEMPHDTVGLALSRGGIRSATFSLGVL